MGACGVRCNDGFAREGAECVPLAPALLSPLSSWTTNESNPEFRTSTSDAFVEYRNEVCRDRACTQRIAQWTATTGASRCPSPITPGIIAYWRSTGVMRDGRTKASAVVPFRTTRRATRGYDTPFFDFDGDGLSDALANQRYPQARSGPFVLFGAVTTPRDTVRLPAIPLPPPRESWMLRVDAAQTIGDFDGDGFSDAVTVVGHPQLHFGGADRNRAAVTTGDFLLNIDPWPQHDGVARSIAPLGDINDDGRSDFVTVSWNGGDRAMEYDLFFGRSDRRVVRVLTTRGINALQIVPGPNCSRPGFRERILYAVGTLTVDSTTRFAAALRVNRYAVSPVFGDAVVPFAEAAIEDVGDIDGDGRNEAVVRSMSHANQFMLLSMDADCNRLQVRAVNSTTDVAAVGRTTDIDGDGTHELIVARRATQSSLEFLSVFRGGPNVLMERIGTWSFPPTYNYRPDFENTYNFAAYTFGSNGDMNGDGLDDFIVGSPAQSPPALYFVGSDLSRWPTVSEVVLPFPAWRIASRAAPSRRLRAPRFTDRCLAR